MRFAGWSSLVVGILMLAQWTFFLAAGQVPELQTEPIALSFHLAAEFVTSAVLIASGSKLLRGDRRAIAFALVGNGMLLYTVVVSPGYFAQLGQWPLVLMFAGLLGLALLSVAKLVSELSADGPAS
jgi:peptidoglycan/LPS O-acetylase OafA/YrhL